MGRPRSWERLASSRHLSRFRSMRGSIWLLAVGAGIVLAPAAGTCQQSGAEGLSQAAIDSGVRRYFASRDFAGEGIGATRWIENGAAYTMVEGKEVARYDTRT